MSKVEVDHIGVVVDDLEDAVARYSAILGPPAKRVELEEVGLRVAEFETANVTIELIQYAGDKAAFAKEVMGEAVGLNHVSLRVGDLAESLEAARRSGLRVQDGFPRRGAHGEVAFFERDAATGLLLEFCEPDTSDTH
jgi:methylmalonyl-CoA/ethylmalonyl-CoA epimerase